MDSSASTDTILDRSRPLVDRVAEARAWLDSHLNIAPFACRVLIESLLPELEVAGDEVGRNWLRFFSAWLLIQSDNYQEALSLMAQVHDAFEARGDNEGLIRSLNALGAINTSLGANDVAIEFFSKAINKADKAGRADLAAAASSNVAQCLYDLEEYEEALKAIEHCREHYIISPWNKGADHTLAGMVYRALGRLEESERELLDAIHRSSESRRDMLEAKQILAELYLDSGRQAEAAALAWDGLERSAEAGERLMEARFRLTRARIALAQGGFTEALGDLEETAAAARALGSLKLESDAERILSEVWRNLGDYKKALDAFQRHAGLREHLRGQQSARALIALREERVRKEARHFEELYREVSSIGEIGRRITANLDLEAVLNTLYDAVNSLMDAPSLYIALADHEAGVLDYRLAIVNREHRAPHVLPLTAESIGTWCVRNRKEVIIQDVYIEYTDYMPAREKPYASATGERSAIFVPLMARDKVVGILSAQSPAIGAYDRRKLETLRAIGGYVAIAIENASLFKRIQDLASLDELTGLYNRRRMAEILEDGYGLVKRYGTDVSLLMVDIDRFKSVNDEHGHDAGDLALKAVAELLKHELRACDELGRYGGEEFIAMLPETDSRAALALAERLRLSLETRPLVLTNSSFISLTMSIGVAMMEPHDSGYEDAVRRADQALYRAKREGRNAVRGDDESSASMQGA